jgi:hypothetical protein
LKLSFNDKWLSDIAFNFELRRYNEVDKVMDDINEQSEKMRSVQEAGQ